MGEDIAKAHFLSLSLKAGSCLASLLLSYRQQFHAPAFSPGAGTHVACFQQGIIAPRRTGTLFGCPPLVRRPHGLRTSPCCSRGAVPEPLGLFWLSLGSKPGWITVGPQAHSEPRARRSLRMNVVRKPSRELRDMSLSLPKPAHAVSQVPPQ